MVSHPEDHFCLLLMCSALPIKEISVGWSWLQGKAVCWKQDMSNNINTFCYKLSSSSTSLYNTYIILHIICNTYFISITIQPTCWQSLSAEHFAVFKGEKCTEEWAMHINCTLQLKREYRGDACWPLNDAIVASALSCAVATFPLPKTTNLAHELFLEKDIYLVVELSW